MALSSGFIYVKNWKKFQHPDVVRGGTRLPWIRDYCEQVDHEEYINLSLNARGALQDLRRLSAMYGNGRVSAQPAYLERRLNWPRRYAPRALERLSEAGFIEIRASKAQAPRKQPAGREREEKEKKNARGRASKPQAARTPRSKEPEPQRNGHLNAEGLEQLGRVVGRIPGGAA